MAWISKNSAGMQIERRDTPCIDADMKSQLEEGVISRYPKRQAATLPVLHAVQERHGYVPHQAIEEVAQLLDVSASEVLDTATFYEEYFFEPKGRYVIWVCQSISCELMGQVDLLEKIKAKLGIDVGQTTDDQNLPSWLAKKS